MRINYFVAAVVCTANLGFDSEQKVWGAHSEFPGDCRHQDGDD